DRAVVTGAGVARPAVLGGADFIPVSRLQFQWLGVHAAGGPPARGGAESWFGGGLARGVGGAAEQHDGEDHQRESQEGNQPDQLPAFAGAFALERGGGHGAPLAWR